MNFLARQNMASNYQNIGSESKVMGASPHQLVDILFDELAIKMDESAQFLEAGDFSRGIACKSKALKIVNGLQASLDFENGGELAHALMSIYIEVSKRLNHMPVEELAQQIRSARAIVSEIASAWKAVG